jgi:hypothetical protein
MAGDRKGLSTEGEAAIEFLAELTKRRGVSDETYAEAVASERSADGRSPDPCLIGYRAKAHQGDERGRVT